MVKIKVIVKEPGKDPEVREIDDSLEAMQEIVGGSIEMVPFPGLERDGVCIVLNEEGKLDGLAPNVQYYQDIIVGSLFVMGSGDEGESASVPDRYINLIIRDLKEGFWS